MRFDNNKYSVTASVPIPKFARTRGSLDTNFGIKGTLGRVLIKSHVRPMPNSGARADIAGLPRRASSGLMQSSNPGADKLRRHACFIQPKLSAVVGQVFDRLWDPRY